MLAFSGCNLWLVWNGRVSTSRPIWLPLCTTSNVTWDPCLSQINKCLILCEILPWLSSHKKWNACSKLMPHHPSPSLYGHGCICLTFFYIISPHAFAFKNWEMLNVFSGRIDTLKYAQPFVLIKMINVHWPVALFCKYQCVTPIFPDLSSNLTEF